MRILILNWRDRHHPEAGGAEKYITVVAEGLAAAGHEVVFRTALYPGALPDEMVNGVRYVRRGGKYTIYPRALLSQVDIRRRRRSDVVIDVQNGMPYLSPLVRQRPTVNLVHHVHREQWPVLFSPRLAAAGWWLESRISPSVYRSTTHVAVSRATQDELHTLGVPLDLIHIIHNGTDDAVETWERSPRPLVTVLGRLVPQKRVEIAIDAVAEISRDVPDIHLRILGSGWWEPVLREYAARSAIADRVSFHGHVSEEEKHRHLAESWVLALPSLKEGWGLVIVEAGMHGTPTVAFRHAGGTKDAIVDGETGLLAGDGTPSFTSALRSVLNDDTLRHRLSRNAARWVRQYRWEESISRWETLLQDIVASSSEKGVGPSAPG